MPSAIPFFNADLMARAPSMGATVIDIFPLISLEMLAPDGLHLAQAGNEMLAETYFGRIKERYEEAQATTARSTLPSGAGEPRSPHNPSGLPPAIR